LSAAVAGDRETGSDVRLAIEAMATRFELVLPFDVEGGGTRLRAIGEEALAEIVRLESRLSAFRPASDISWINAYASDRPVRVEPALFALLQRCLALSAATAGAFDITVGPLMRAWQSGGDIAGARARVGYQHVDLDAHRSTIRFARSGMSLDLGAAGKGYAIDEAIAILAGHGCSSALLHGGTSSVHAIGRAPGGEGWQIAWAPPGGAERVFGLSGSALSVSAAHGRTFRRDGRDYGHVIDPSTGWPSEAADAAVVTGPRSMDCDALSTALLVLGPGWLPALRAGFPGYDGSAGTPASKSSAFRQS
jgi:FAD:protein FMN transferase